MRRRWLPLCVAATVLLAGCGDDDDATPAAVLDEAPTTERTATTRSVEAEVEAAYLRSWDVYAEAMRTFDTSELDDAYAEEALRLRLAEVGRVRDANTPVLIDVEHNVTVRLVESGEAVVRDEYVNHSVLLNGETGKPIEDDPNEVVRREYILIRADGTWKISLVTKL